MTYKYLSADEQNAITAEVLAQFPTREQEQKSAEAAHWRSVVEAKLGVHGMPDEYCAPPQQADVLDDSQVEAVRSETAMTSGRDGI